MLLLMIVFSAYAIFQDSGQVPAWPSDQAFVENANLSIGRKAGHWYWHYPSLQYSGGITSSIVAGLYKLVIPTSRSDLNWHLRIFAMAGYMVSAAALIHTLIRNHGARLLGFLLIGTSGFQFIQPSSEIIAGVFLTTFVIAVCRAWPTPVAALLLVGFALSKVECVLAALLIAIAWWWQMRSRNGGASGTWIPLWTLFWFLIFLLPSFLVVGADVLSGNRSMNAFTQHYVHLLYPHQFLPLPDGLDLEYPKGAEILFPKAGNVLQLIINYPRRYVDFLSLSFVESLIGVLASFKLLLIPLGVVALRPKPWQDQRLPIVILAIAAVFTILPAWLFAFVHLRYLTRLFPLLVVIAIAGSLAILKTGRSRLLLIWLPAWLTVVIQLFRINTIWVNAMHGAN